MLKENGMDREIRKKGKERGRPKREKDGRVNR
jgi:hypothetical protein